MSSEPDRATALGGLAVHLAAPLLFEALAEVDQLGDIAAKGEALAALAPHLPQELREQRLEALLARIRDIPDGYKRVKTAVLLADRIRPQLREGLIDYAVAAIKEVENWYYHEQSQILVGQCIARLGYGQRALEVIQAIKQQWTRVEALSELVPILSEPTRTNLAREVLTEISRAEAGHPDSGSMIGKAQLYARISPNLPEPMKTEALEEAVKTLRETSQGALHDSDEMVWYTTLVMLATAMADAGYTDEALSVVRQIKYGHYRSEALAQIGPHLSEVQLRESIEAARAVNDLWTLAGLAPCMTAISDIKDALVACGSLGVTWANGQGLDGLSPHLAQLPADHLYPLWREIFPALSSSTRQTLIAHIRALLPVLKSLAGSDVAMHIFDAVQDTARWWP